MVDFLSSWAQGIIIAVIIATLIELILPNGNSKKYVKVVIGLYILFTIIFPVINKFQKDKIDIKEILNTGKYEKELEKSDGKISKRLEDNNTKTIKDMYKSNLTLDIKSKLEEKGYEVDDINITLKDDEKYTIENIALKLKDKENNNEKYKENNKEEYKNNGKQRKKKEIKQININDINVKINNNVEEKINNEDSRSNTETEDELIKKQKDSIKDYLSKTYYITEENIEIV